MQRETPGIGEEVGWVERVREPTTAYSAMDRKLKQRIGIVLSKVPGYSETFFRSKVRVLERSGARVLLLASGGKDPGSVCRHWSQGYDVDAGRLEKVWGALKAACRLSASPRRSIALFRRNRRDGFPFRKNLVSLLNAAHIIGHDLDWIHFGFATNAIFLENLAGVMGARMAVSIRGYDISIHPLKYTGCYSLLWKRIDRLHHISDALYRKALADGLADDVQAVRIEPAADTGILSSVRKPSLPSEGFTRFMTIGRLTWKKGYVQTLTALAALKAAGHRFSYRIVGEGDGLEEVLYMRRALDLEKEVVLEGRKSHAETLDMLMDCDIYLQYSVQEGYCNAVVEAQLMARPCIVSDAEGLPENVLDGITGWVVPMNDPQRLQEKIREVVALSEEERARIGKAASERIASSFSLETQLAKFVRFYED